MTDYSADRRIAWLICTPIAWIMCLLVFYFYWKFPPVRRPPCRLVIWRFVCEFVFVSGFFFSAAYEYSADENVYFYTAVQVCECGMLFWTFWSLRDVRAIASNPFDAVTASDAMYHLVSWAACAVVGVGMIMVYENSDKTSKDDRMDTIKRVNYGLAALEIMFMLLTIRTMMVLYKRLSWGLPLSDQSRKRVIFQELTMGGGFVFSDLLAILIMFGFKTAGSPVALDVLRQLRVIFDTLVWMYVNQIHVRMLQEYCGCGSGGELDETNERVGCSPAYP